MKVLLLNGSPNADGCTYTALKEIAGELETNGVNAEFFHLGKAKVRGCIGCGACHDKNLGRCIFDDDIANRIVDAIDAADGVIIGSPVYYAGPNGALCAVLDRAFFSTIGDKFAGKPGAAIVSCRRGGSTAALDRLNKYFTISRMPLVSSQYWNMVHGNEPEEVLQDLEGMQTMRTLGAEMARLVKALDGVPPIQREERVFTNYIR